MNQQLPTKTLTTSDKVSSTTSQADRNLFLGLYHSRLVHPRPEPHSDLSSSYFDDISSCCAMAYGLSRELVPTTVLQVEQEIQPHRR